MIFQVCKTTLDTIDVCLHTTDIYSIQVTILVLDSTDIFLYTNDFTVNIILMIFCCFPFKSVKNLIKRLLNVLKYSLKCTENINRFQTCMCPTNLSSNFQ